MRLTKTKEANKAGIVSMGTLSTATIEAMVGIRRAIFAARRMSGGSMSARVMMGAACRLVGTVPNTGCKNGMPRLVFVQML
jgi:hypothetical protein